MNGYIETGGRQRYLALGFLAQRIIDGLIRYVGDDRPGELSVTLDEAIAKLQDQRSKKPLSYQELRTFRQAQDLQPDIEILGVLSELRASLDDSTEESLQKADTAIRWFGRLQNQALRNYSSSSEPIPEGVRKLCQTD